MVSETLRRIAIREPERKYPPAIPFVYVGQIAPLMGFLGEIGAPVSSFLQRSHIPEVMLEEPAGMVPLHLVHRLLEIAASAEGIGNLGLVLGRLTSAFDLPILGRELQRAVTVHDYLHKGMKLIGRVQPGEHFWLTLESDQVRFHQILPGRLCEGRHHADLYTLTVTIEMIRRFVGDEWSPREISLLATERRFIGDCCLFGDAEIRLGQTHSSFTIPTDLLMRPVRFATRGTRPGPGSTGLAARSMPQDFLAGFETLAVALLKAGACRIDALAEAAGMTTRTLQRRLAENGLSYSTLVAKTRQSLAADWLSRTELPIREIATNLGYTDPANFTRAFRRSTGSSPRQYRLACGRSANRPGQASTQRAARRS
jgi:AraC-like DNA-binding protein